MEYTGLRDELSQDPSPRIVAFPDGSADTYSTIRGRDGHLDSLTAFERELAGGRESFRLEPEAREAGGQAVNMAKQVHELGGRVELYGHLDDPAFADLPFTSVSMGSPAEVSVLQLGDDAVQLATESASIRDWTAADLRAAMGGDFAPMLDADGICCGNVASFPALLDVFRALGSRGIDGGAFVLDPGDLTSLTRETLSEWFAVLDTLDDADVVVSVNRREMTRLAEQVGVQETSDADLLERLQAESALPAVAYHGKECAVAATPSGVVRVPTPTVSTPERTTGAGDRFSAGLAFGLAADWDWRPALALANACSSHYVETATTVDTDAVLNGTWNE